MFELTAAGFAAFAASADSKKSLTPAAEDWPALRAAAIDAENRDALLGPEEERKKKEEAEGYSDGYYDPDYFFEDEA